MGDMGYEDVSQDLKALIYVYKLSLTRSTLGF